MTRLRKQLIGLTGSIGSGKSTVSRRLHGFGAFIVDADEISRALLLPSGACYDAVVAQFGSGILRPDGSIDRAALAEIVFADVDNRRLLNGIVHPEVRRQMKLRARAFAQENPLIPVILDVPLLFESGMEQDAELTVLVYAMDSVRLQRIVLRDGCSVEHAKKRMASQMPQEQKRKLCDVLIDNSGTLENLYTQVDAWYAALVADTVEREG